MELDILFNKVKNDIKNKSIEIVKRKTYAKEFYYITDFDIYETLSYRRFRFHR